ncbi:MAG: S41 family peptidase, partial [Firmicutes bacterium]|nr:S41 family peptidase [Bacillota bacterium]
DYDTYTEFKEAVSQLQSEGMEKMIIDLRDNPGGDLDIVCSIADMLLPEGTITYMEYKDGTRKDYTSDAECLDIPMAVLINENSASASEVLTGALRDYDAATVIGTTSYGKGIVQSVYPFADGSGMSLTIAKYYSPNGTCIHGVGIEPDITVELSEEYDGYYASYVPREDDTQLAKAVEVLSEK